MKKLSLNTVDFAGAEVLTREQLKKVMGGEGSGGNQCGTYPSCSTASCTIPDGPCKGAIGTCGSTGATSTCTCGAAC